MKIPSTQLIQDCIKGKRASVQALFELCYPYVMGISIKFNHNVSDANEAVNEAFFRILKGLPKLKSVESFQAYCKTTTIRTIINLHKSKVTYRDVMAPVDFQEQTEIGTTISLNEVAQTIDANDLLQLIHELKPIEKQILVLHAIEGYPYHEIEELTGVSSSTCRWHMNNARKNLIRLLEVFQPGVYKTLKL